MLKKGARKCLNEYKFKCHPFVLFFLLPHNPHSSPWCTGYFIAEAKSNNEIFYFFCTVSSFHFFSFRHHSSPGLPWRELVQQFWPACWGRLQSLSWRILLWGSWHHKTQRSLQWRVCRILKMCVLLPAKPVSLWMHSSGIIISETLHKTCSNKWSKSHVTMMDDGCWICFRTSLFLMF